ncbi:MAG: hypothetical protein ABIJ96_17730 [Elusimicrobiota bacterium]
MIADKKTFFLGAGLMAVFVVVMVLAFSPLINGLNALEYSDALYNSISKGSAYYIPEARSETAKHTGVTIRVGLSLDDAAQATRAARLLTASGAEAELRGAELDVAGELSAILDSCLADAEAMYRNKGDEISGRYGGDARLALYDWWTALKSMDAALKKQKKFKEAKTVTLVKKKAVETAYNFYGIEPQKITDRLGVVIFSLLFYVLYTVWYGFAILFMFEGWGLRLGH